MKVLVALLALVAVAYSERLCRSNCQSTDNFDDLTSNGCQCDDACVDANDCCDSYFDFCVEDAGCRNNCGSDEQSSDANGRCFCDDTCEDADDCCSNYAAECGGETDDTACQGCPDGAQTSTSGSGRISCYCDAACVDSGDCCPSYKKYCADTPRQSFCALLTSSKSVFCDTAMRKAYKLKVVSKIDTTFDPKSGKGSFDWVEDTYNRTCLLYPEIVEDEAVTCDTIRGFNWRYGCTGLNSVWAQGCTTSSCRDRDCDAPWRRDYWGATSRIALNMDPRGETDPDHPEFPAGYGQGDEDGMASQAGRCLMSFQMNCVDGALPEDSDRAAAWVYGCLDTTYDAADVEFLDWETAYSSSTPLSVDNDMIDYFGNGDSFTSQLNQVALTFGNRDAEVAEQVYLEYAFYAYCGKGNGGSGCEQFQVVDSCPTSAPTPAPTSSGTQAPTSTMTLAPTSTMTLAPTLAPTPQCPCSTPAPTSAPVSPP